MELTVTQLAFAFGGSNPSLPTKKVGYIVSNFFYIYTVEKLADADKKIDNSNWKPYN